MSILLFGSDGQLGFRLSTLLRGQGQVRAVNRAQLDLCETGSVRRLVLESRPRIVINAAAYTAVDRAETEPDTARLVNAEAPRAMAEAAAEIGALMVHFSTDYVFDGTSREPYTESTRVHPLGVYGRSKLDGENAVTASGCPALILRTAWLYSNRGRNFLNTILRLAGERDELRIVNDQTGSPTYADALAVATVQILDRMFSGDSIRAEYCGLYHAACGGSATWWEFASRIVQLAGLSGRVRVLPIPSSEYPTPVQRPAYSVLSGEKLKRTFGIQLPDWKLALEECLTERNVRG